MTPEAEDKMISEAMVIALDSIADQLTCGKAELSVVYVKDEKGTITAQAKTKAMVSLAVMRDPALLPTDLLKLAGGHALSLPMSDAWIAACQKLRNGEIDELTLWNMAKE